MKTYLIQRNLPSAGTLTLEERKAIATKSCAVINELGEENIRWIHSYVTDDNIWCIYQSYNVEILREHARRGQFPCDQILEVNAMLSPALAETVNA